MNALGITLCLVMLVGGQALAQHTSRYCDTCPRDSRGNIQRDATAKREFLKQETGSSRVPPGYVVDHIVPLKKGGCDCPANMQLQTKEEAKAKDRWE
jgi:hypothetical protein